MLQTILSCIQSGKSVKNGIAAVQESRIGNDIEIQLKTGGIPAEFNKK